MDTDRAANTERMNPPEWEEETAADAPEEQVDKEGPATEDTDAERDGEIEASALPSARPRSRPDFGCIGAVIVVLALALLFGWVLVSAIADVAQEHREAELRRWQAEDTYRKSVARRSSGGSSSGGSKSGSASSGGSSFYGSSGSGNKSKSSGGSTRTDEYTAADFGNPEDFYDEHYDDFFDYYDAEDYWNEHN